MKEVGTIIKKDETNFDNIEFDGTQQKGDGFIDEKSIEEISKRNGEIKHDSNNAFKQFSVKKLISRRSKITPNEKTAINAGISANQILQDSKFEKKQSRQHLNYTEQELGQINYSLEGRCSFFDYPMLYSWKDGRAVKRLTVDIPQKLKEYFDIDSCIKEIDLESKMVIPNDIPTLEGFCAKEDFKIETFRYYMNGNLGRGTPGIPGLKDEFERAMLGLEHVLLNGVHQKVINPATGWKHLALINDKYKAKYEFEANINMNHQLIEGVNAIESMSPAELMRLASGDKDALQSMQKLIAPIEEDNIIDAEIEEFGKNESEFQSFNK